MAAPKRTERSAAAARIAQVSTPPLRMMQVFVSLLDVLLVMASKAEPKRARREASTDGDDEQHRSNGDDDEQSCGEDRSSNVGR